MNRIALVEPENLTPDQAEIYHNHPSGKTNLYRLLAQAKTLHPGFSAYLTAMMTQVEIPPLEREIIILAVLHLESGEYEWAQHLQVADSMGIAKEKVDAIARDRFGDPVFNERERALLAFTRQVVKCVRVDDFVFKAVAAFYDPRQLVETIFVIGAYMTILRISEVAELEVDAVLGAAVWKHAGEAATTG
jgi:alkylhydroperoxidase family enzyme